MEVIRSETGGPLSIIGVAEWVALVRDITLLLLLLVALFVVLFLYRKASTLLDSTKRAMKNAEDIVSTVSEKVVGPAAAGTGLAFGAGKVMAFLLGVSGRRRKRKRGGSDNGR